ncbi:hypothetical protein ACUTAH_27955 [Metapseudomonas furukawaii]|uniref:hypothetical protein n=1 Tax=Metapseudomonas furukawaii TaxID=1149133 RepID=UPI004045AFC1
MKLKALVLTLLLVLLQPIAWPALVQAATAQDGSALSTRLAQRDLWVEHIFWVRNYVIANQSGRPEQARAAADGVVANATAIANSIAPLYGQPAADQLLKLLAGHWGAVKQYSDATLAKDAAARTTAVHDLTRNAGAIADFLAGANPYLPKDALVGMLQAHGGHHVAQIDLLAKADFSGEAVTWGAMRSHMLVLADTLTAALVKQFPDTF